jgi:adenosylcobinamide-phosphate synthase
MLIIASILLGMLLDFCFGDPYWMPHPVVWIGKCISAGERLLRRLFPHTEKGLLSAGCVLAVIVPLMSLLGSLLVLWVAYRIAIWLWFVLHTFWAYQILAARCLSTESNKVYRALQDGDLPLARKQLSGLVGRETKTLSEEEVVKACVETVAENTSDGEIAPLFYLLLGGVPLGFFYKAVNTLDSMVGYRNETYEYLGKVSAKLDDICNWIPARLSAWCLIAASFLLSLDGRQAIKIYRRDRKNHLSPNSAQTESVAAGAMGIQLGGTHIYFGKTVEKPTIGDATRQATAQDIRTTNRMMIVASVLFAILFAGLLSLVHRGWLV